MPILIIEDDRKTAALLSDCLIREGFEVAHAADGEAGLAMALEGGFEVLLVDVMLPKLDGLSLVRELRTRGDITWEWAWCRPGSRCGLRTVGFGHDLLAPPGTGISGRAFVSNYQKIGLLEGSRLAILKPTRLASTYDCDLGTGATSPLGETEGRELTADAVSYYQCASWLFKTGRLKQAYAAEHLPLPPQATGWGLTQGP